MDFFVGACWVLRILGAKSYVSAILIMMIIRLYCPCEYTNNVGIGQDKTS